MSRPTARVLLVAIIASATAGCGPAAAPCVAGVGWQRGMAGKAAVPGCRSQEYRAAHELGASLHALEAEHAALQRQIDAEPEDAGALRRRQRQLAVDIEAIRGVAVVEGWEQAAR